MDTQAATAVFDPAGAVEIIASGADRDGALLPILHALMDAFGHVPPEAVPIVAGALNLSRAEVHGVVTFYHAFRTEPPPRHVLKLCRAEACQARGGDAVADYAAAAAAGTRTDIAVEPIYCLGLCASGPAALMDGRAVARLTPARIDDLLGQARP
jgi:formate dehydrogenase subunit gamma